MANRFLFDGAQVEIKSLPIRWYDQMWIKVAGVWKKATTWIKVAGVWKQATPNINVSGTWK